MFLDYSATEGFHSQAMSRPVSIDLHLFKKQGCLLKHMYSLDITFKVIRNNLFFMSFSVSTMSSSYIVGKASLHTYVGSCQNSMLRKPGF